MDLPCEITESKDPKETRCGYVGRAVDFYLAGDALVRIHIHRNERSHPTLKDATYGPYNGWFAKGPRLEMLREASLEEFGQPMRIEPVTEAEPLWGTVERHHYENFVVEYDELRPGHVILGGVILEKPAAKK
jgi:hypothetical protein